jgi:hypothetical protein
MLKFTNKIALIKAIKEIAANGGRTFTATDDSGTYPGIGLKLAKDIVEKIEAEATAEETPVRFVYGVDAATIYYGRLQFGNGFQIQISDGSIHNVNSLHYTYREACDSICTLIQ